MTGEGRLSILQRHCEPDLVAKVLGQAHAILPGPTEADGILRVDSHWERFRAVIGPMPGFGSQTPHLAPGEGESVVKGRLSPCLPLAQRIAVALVVVGGHTG